MVSKTEDKCQINDDILPFSSSGIGYPSSVLTCENISCDRGGRRVFEGLGFCLPTASLLILNGANGSGKTSLMKMLAGLILPSMGEISWNGTPIHASAEYKNIFTYVGHKNAIKPESTVLENLRFWARMQGREILIPAAMHYWDLTHKQHMPCGMLSSGWQRRVALARLIFSPAPLWLLDEPTNYLDEEAALLFTSLIESRVRQGGVVVAASHNVHSAFTTHTLKMEDFAPLANQEPGI